MAKSAARCPYTDDTGKRHKDNCVDFYEFSAGNIALVNDATRMRNEIDTLRDNFEIKLNQLTQLKPIVVEEE